MARRGNSARAPHLQVGSRLVASLAALALFATPAYSATDSPTATQSPTASSSASPTAKSSVTPKASATPKPSTPKKTTKKSTKKRVSVSPSPTAKWPPVGFSQQGEVYAKIPSSKELIGILSADKVLAKKIADCTKYACGAVQAAAVTGCLWWEISLTLTKSNNRLVGVFTQVGGATNPKAIKTFLVVSPELLADGITGKVSAVVCHHDARDTSLPTTDYKKNDQ